MMGMALARCYFWLIWNLKLYPLWSRLYRILFNRKYNGVLLKSGLTPWMAQASLTCLKWSKDGPRELWDAVSDPRWVQYCLYQVALGKEQPIGALDCDDFAAWAATVISPDYHPRCLCVMWMDGGWKLKGHTVCKWFNDDNGTWNHVGNWGLRGPYHTLTGLVVGILNEVGCNLDDFVGCVSFTPDLKTHRFLSISFTEGSR